MKKLVVFCSLCISVGSFGQQKELDSLRTALEGHLQKDTTRFRMLINASDYTVSNPSESKIYLKEALKLATELDFKKGMAEAYCSLAYYFADRMDFAQAVDNGLNALRGYEGINDSTGLFEATNFLAGIYSMIPDFEKANEYMDNMQKLVAHNKSLVDEADFYQNMGFYTMKQNKFEEGSAWITKALKIHQENRDHFKISVCYFLIAKAQYGLGNLETALSYYLKAVEANKLTNHPSALQNTTSTHEGAAHIYIKMKEFRKASQHLDTSFIAATQINNANMLLKIYTDRAELYEAQGNLKEALKFQRLYQVVRDSVITQEKSKQLADAQIKYETEKKEQEITLLEQKSKIQTLWRNSLVAGLLFTLTAAVIIYLLQRSRTRKTKLLLDTQQLLNQQMQETDKTKSRFFANISHEFRTPLTLIISPIEERLLANDIPQKEKISFQSVRRSANRLLELVNQLLELSKLESGFMKLNPQPANLYRFIMPVLSSFDSMADVGQVRYTKEVRIAETTMLFDGDKLEKILSNLLSNAFKFSPKSGKVEVKAVATEKGKSIVLTLEVKNTSFISPDTLDKIFEPFFQGEHEPARGVPGTGLGLSLVKELVKLHGGDIHVSSNATDGTTFVVTLTFEKTDMPDAVLVRAAEKIEATAFAEEPEENLIAATDRTKETILIVEDNQDVRTMIRHGLEAHYNIIEAATGKGGVEMARENAVDLVVSDVMMPVMSGVELCHLLKSDERTSHVPIILLTARADHESKLEGLRTGADDYVVKPFNMQELLARIANLIEQRKKLIQKYNRGIVIHPHEITVTPMDERFIQKAIQLMEDNLDNTELTVDKLSEELGMSRTNLNRKLKAITGLATNEFMQDFRLRRAAMLIEKKADTVSQIAYQVGFNDQSYFTKCFRKKFGKTPSEYGI